MKSIFTFYCFWCYCKSKCIYLDFLGLVLVCAQRTQPRPKLAARLTASSAEVTALDASDAGLLVVFLSSFGGSTLSVLTLVSMIPMLMCIILLSLMLGFMKMHHVMVLR